MKHSILKQLRSKRKESLIDPSVYEICTEIKVEKDVSVVLADACVAGHAWDIGIYAIARAVNAAAAKGAEAVGVRVRLVMPEDLPEEGLKRIVDEMESICGTFDIWLLNLQAEVSSLVTGILVYATALGHMPKEDLLPENEGRKQDIVMSKWVGLEGSLIALGEKRTELEERFQGAFLRQLESLKSQIIALPEIYLARSNGVRVIRQIGEGGILAALWELAEERGMGLHVAGEQFSIRQETIEICEHLLLNPYRMTSAGSLLLLTDDGQRLTQLLKSEGIQSTVLGQMVPGRERVISRRGEIQYINRPEPDELIKIIN